MSIDDQGALLHTGGLQTGRGGDGTNEVVGPSKRCDESEMGTLPIHSTGG